jgi:hypothetical protein
MEHWHWEHTRLNKQMQKLGYSSSKSQNNCSQSFWIDQYKIIQFIFMEQPMVHHYCHFFFLLSMSFYPLHSMHQQHQLRLLTKAKKLKLKLKFIQKLVYLPPLYLLTDISESTSFHIKSTQKFTQPSRI